MFAACEYSFETNSFCHAFYENDLSIKDLEKLAEFNLLQNLNLCTHISVCITRFGPFGEIGANFSTFSSGTQFAKFKYRKSYRRKCKKTYNLCS